MRTKVTEDVFVGAGWPPPLMHLSPQGVGEFPDGVWRVVRSVATWIPGHTVDDSEFVMYPHPGGWQAGICIEQTGPNLLVWIVDDAVIWSREPVVLTDRAGVLRMHLSPTRWNEIRRAHQALMSYVDPLEESLMYHVYEEMEGGWESLPRKSFPDRAQALWYCRQIVRTEHLTRAEVRDAEGAVVQRYAWDGDGAAAVDVEKEPGC